MAATATQQQRAIEGDKAQRIVEAMRSSVARRGVAGSTFDHVAREARVSRGLLHYYFGTKERLLVEVVRRDSEIRIEKLDEPLANTKSVDDVLDVLVTYLLDMIENEPEFFLLLFELFTAGRHQPDIRRELGSLYSRARGAVAAVLREKQDEGVLALRFDAESVITHMFAAGDGAVLQLLTDPTLDAEAAGAASYQVYRFLLDTRVEAG